MAIQFNPIGQPIVIDNSIIHHSAVNVTALFDYEMYPKRVDFPYSNLPEGDPNKYYVASSPDSPIPLAYRTHKGTDSQKGFGSNLYGINNCVVTEVALGAYNVLTISDGINRYEYWHCSAILVSVGQQVDNNTIVALEGNTSPDPIASHLHLVIYDSAGDIIDGLKIMAGEDTPTPPPYNIKSLWFLDIW